MANEIQFSDDYNADLDAAIDNFLLVSARAAERFAAQHDRCVQALQEFARLGEEHAPSLFSLPVGTSGYRIVYSVNGAEVTFVALENVRRRRR